MWHGLDFVDLKNPEVRPPTARLEERIMIGTEMPRCALTMDGGVEHAACINAGNDAAVYADADEATRELVHDYEYPVTPEYDGLAAKEVDAPQAVSGVTDERQPRGSRSVRGRAIVFRQHAVHDVLVDVDPKRLRDDQRDPWTTEPRCRSTRIEWNRLAAKGLPHFWCRMS
jgi:hypothetical protein